MPKYVIRYRNNQSKEPFYIQTAKSTYGFKYWLTEKPNKALIANTIEEAKRIKDEFTNETNLADFSSLYIQEIDMTSKRKECNTKDCKYIISFNDITKYYVADLDLSSESFMTLRSTFYRKNALKMSYKEVLMVFNYFKNSSHSPVKLAVYEVISL